MRITLKTQNTRNNRYESALGVDMGIRRFMTAVSDYGDIYSIESATLLEYCRRICEGTLTRAALSVYLLKIIQCFVDDWCKKGICAVYVGCTNGNYEAICNGTEHLFYICNIFPVFLEILKTACEKAGIYCETAEFDESYTSKANGIAGDYVPSFDASPSPVFTGEHCMASYHVDENLLIDADVNAAINILHKAGFDVKLDFSSALFTFVTLTKAEGV